MIILENVSKTFKDKTVLQNTSLTIEDGKIVGFVGRNGSGKTVLFKLICGLLRPTTGTVTVQGKQLGKDCDFAPDVGVLIETPSFISYESGFRNLRDLAERKSPRRRFELPSALSVWMTRTKSGSASILSACASALVLPRPSWSIRRC